MGKKEVVETIIALCVLGGFVFGAMNHFATAEDLRMTQMELRTKIVGDQVIDLQRQVWQLEDRNGGPDCLKWKNDLDRKKYRELLLKLDELKKRQEILIKETIK